MKAGCSAASRRPPEIPAAAAIIAHHSRMAQLERHEHAVWIEFVARKRLAIPESETSVESPRGFEVVP